MILKIDSLFMEIQWILTHYLRDFNGSSSWLKIRIMYLRLSVPTPPPLWHSKRAATGYDCLAQTLFLWCRVPGSPSRICIMIGIKISPVLWYNLHSALQPFPFEWAYFKLTLVQSRHLQLHISPTIVKFSFALPLVVFSQRNPYNSYWEFKKRTFYSVIIFLSKV